MKKFRTIFLLISLFIMAQNAFGQKYMQGCITPGECVANYYDPTTKTNHKGVPMLIVTMTRENNCAARAHRYLPDYIARNNPRVILVEVNLEDVPAKLCTEWCNNMDAASKEKLGRYQAPMLYFVNTNGTVDRIAGFAEFYVNTVKAGDEKVRQKFQRLVSDLR